MPSQIIRESGQSTVKGKQPYEFGLKNTLKVFPVVINPQILIFYFYRNVNKDWDRGRYHAENLRLSKPDDDWFVKSDYSPRQWYPGSSECSLSSYRVSIQWYQLLILSLNEVTWRDSVEYSSPSFGNVILYAGKPVCSRRKPSDCFWRHCKARLLTWGLVSDSFRTLEFWSRLRSTIIVQHYTTTETSDIVEKDGL